MELINDHCKDCNSRTKLLIRKEKKNMWWCSMAKDCPHSREATKIQKPLNAPEAAADAE